MIITARFNLGKLSEHISTEALVHYDSDTATVVCSNVIILHATDLTDDQHDLVMEKEHSMHVEVDSCALLDLIGKYNREGKLLDVQMLPGAKFYEAIK